MLTGFKYGDDIWMDQFTDITCFLKQMFLQLFLLGLFDMQRFDGHLAL